MDEYARNQAIEHLAEALYLFNGIRPDSTEPVVQVSIAPGDDPARCHTFDLTAKQAEALADAIDSVSAYAMSQTVGLSSPAAVFATQHPNTAALIADTFDEIFAETDPKSFLDEVFTAPDPAKSGLAYEALLSGETDGDA